MVVDRTIQQCQKDISAEDSSVINSLLALNAAALDLPGKLPGNEDSPRTIRHIQRSLRFPRALLDGIQVVRSSLVPILRILRPDSSLQGDTRTCVGEVASAVNWRTTSKAGDEVLAIAALLNLDSNVLSRISPAHRLREFFLMLSSSMTAPE